MPSCDVSIYHFRYMLLLPFPLADSRRFHTVPQRVAPFGVRGNIVWGAGSLDARVVIKSGNVHESNRAGSILFKMRQCRMLVVKRLVSGPRVLNPAWRNLRENQLRRLSGSCSCTSIMDAPHVSSPPCPSRKVLQSMLCTSQTRLGRYHTQKK